MFEFPEDPAKKELERMIELTRKAIGPLSMADIERVKADEPWTQHGLSKQQWDSATGLLSVHGELERAASKEYQRVIDLASGKIPKDDLDRITGKNIGCEMLEKQFSAASVAREIEEQRLVKPPLGMPVPSLNVDLDPFRREREKRKQRDDEMLDLQRRSTAASEQTVRNEQLATLAAQERELVEVQKAKTETRRWQIGMLATLVALFIGAVSALWVFPTWDP